MRLEDFQVYTLAMELGEEIYAIAIKWDYFQIDTLGKQIVRSSDSIAANLSEGMGRFHYKERKNFSYYSRGSLCETKTWITKVHNRNLVSDESCKSIIRKIETIGIKLNNYIKKIGPQSN